MSTPVSTPPGGPEGPSGPPATPATSSEVAVVLSAERVEVAVHRLPRERVRLLREIHTRQVELTVSVRREVLRIERLPVEGDDVDAPAAVPAEDASLDVVLREERPVVQLERVPYERVRVAVERIPLTARLDTSARREVADVVTEPAAPTPAPPVPTGTTGRTTRTP